MKYLISMYRSQQGYDRMAVQAAAVSAFMESFGKDLAGTGELVDGHSLTAPAQARRIRLRDGVPVVTGSPYADTDEVLAGYWLLECSSFDRATQIATGLANSPGPGHTRAMADVRVVAESREEVAP